MYKYVHMYTLYWTSLYCSLSQGCTELTIIPLTPNGKIWKLPLNCKQCRIFLTVARMWNLLHVHVYSCIIPAPWLQQYSGILRITVNGRKANFTYVDPTLCICPPDTKKWVTVHVHVCVYNVWFSTCICTWTYMYMYMLVQCTRSLITLCLHPYTIPTNPEWERV